MTPSTVFQAIGAASALATMYPEYTAHREWVDASGASQPVVSRRSEGVALWRSVDELIGSRVVEAES